MAISCGIVGLPNVGKSTLFNALSSAGAAVANYPFCTIEPNVGVVPVPDARLDALVEVIADNAALLARGEDNTFQNKVHLAMQAKGFETKKPSDDSDD